MRTFFRGQSITANINTQELLEYDQWKEKASASARTGKFSFLVKGWNYKFDLLDELGDQFVDDSSREQISKLYRQLINNTGLNAENIIFNIAGAFIDNTVMIPLVGLQNYAVYTRSNNNPVAAAFDENQDIEILLLPYYWRKK
jgi:hypothetical protein